MIENIRTRVDRRFAILALLLAGLLATGISSLALLTDTLTVNNSFSVSTLDLVADGEQSITASFTLEAGGPSANQTLAMENTGNTELRYALSSVTSGALHPNLYTLIQYDPNGDCVGADLVVLYSQPPGGNPAFGSTMQGQQTGDRILAAGASETLCIDHSASAGAAGTASQTLTFSAEQTPANP